MTSPVVIAGGGPAGLAAALSAARSGRSVIVVEKRSRSVANAHKRFQAAILDRQPLDNLAHLGVSARCVEPVRRLVSLDKAANEDGSVAYPAFQPVGSLAPSAELDCLAGRRHIAGLAVISALEDELLNAVRIHPSVQLLQSSEIVAIKSGADCVSLVVRSKDGTTTLDASLLGVCDGANSDRRGAMRLLSEHKQTIAPESALLVFQEEPCIGAGELRIRLNPQHASLSAMAFGTRQGTVVYAGLPSSWLHAPEAHVHALRHELKIQLKLAGRPSIAPEIVAQQARQAPRLVVGERIFILGDAAFSGSAALGVYLNRALLDAQAFGEVCRSQTIEELRRAGAGFAQRLNNRLMHQLRLEEAAVSAAFNSGELAGLAPAVDWLGLYLRYALRWKSGRNGLVRMGMVNTLDASKTMSRVASSIYDSVGFPRFAHAARTLDDVLGLLQRNLE